MRIDRVSFFSPEIKFIYLFIYLYTVKYTLCTRAFSLVRTVGIHATHIHLSNMYIAIRIQYVQAILHMINAQCHLLVPLFDNFIRCFSLWYGISLLGIPKSNVVSFLQSIYSFRNKYFQSYLYSRYCFQISCLDKYACTYVHFSFSKEKNILNASSAFRVSRQRYQDN